MIAARINRRVIEPAYLEELWSTRFVRAQLERGARTTNGTHKINQKVLASVRIPLPPISAQQEFAKVKAVIDRIHHRLSDELPDRLFGSLVQRAFRGEL